MHHRSTRDRPHVTTSRMPRSHHRPHDCSHRRHHRRRNAHFGARHSDATIARSPLARTAAHGGIIDVHLHDTAARIDRTNDPSAPPIPIARSAPRVMRLRVRRRASTCRASRTSHVQLVRSAPHRKHAASVHECRTRTARSPPRRVHVRTCARAAPSTRSARPHARSHLSLSLVTAHARTHNAASRVCAVMCGVPHCVGIDRHAGRLSCVHTDVPPIDRDASRVHDVYNIDVADETAPLDARPSGVDDVGHDRRR